MKGIARFAIHISLLALSSLSSLLAAQTPFDGTWHILINESRFSPKPMVTFLSEGWFHCQSCNPKLDVRADGSDQPVIGQAYDTVSVREINSKTIELKFKKAGTIVTVDTHSVSRDGNKLTVKTTAYFPNGGPPVTAETTAVRIGPAPARINSVSGQWRIASMKESENGLLVTYKSNGEELNMSQPDGESFTAKFDGEDYPSKGAIGYNTVSIRRVDKNTFEEIDKRDGAIVNIARNTVSPDGRKMTVVISNRLSDRTTTYIAVKQ